MIGTCVHQDDGGLESTKEKERKQEMTGIYIPAIHEDIETLLAVRIPSKDGGFGPVQDKDLHLLWNIAHAIISAKWEPDADNDYPVEVIFVNRNDREHLSYIPVKYRHLDKKRNLKDIMFNLRAAMRDVTLSLDLDDIEEGSA